MKKNIILSFAVLALAVSCTDRDEIHVDRLVDNYALVTIPAPDLTGITDNGKEVLRLYRQAADEVDKIYWRQAFAEGESFLGSLTDPAEKLYAGIKFGIDGINVALSIAVHTDDERVFVEAIDCRSQKDGMDWICDFLRQADVRKVIVDGANGRELLSQTMKDYGLKKPIIPSTAEVIVANNVFEQAVFAKEICHAGQPSLTTIVSNCEHRAIGTNGGFGFKSILIGADVALMDSMIFAHWLCKENKERTQRIMY